MCSREKNFSEKNEIRNYRNQEFFLGKHNFKNNQSSRMEILIFFFTKIAIKYQTI